MPTSADASWKNSTIPWQCRWLLCLSVYMGWPITFHIQRPVYTSYRTVCGTAKHFLWYCKTYKKTCIYISHILCTVAKYTKDVRLVYCFVESYKLKPTLRAVCPYTYICLRVGFLCVHWLHCLLGPCIANLFDKTYVLLSTRYVLADRICPCFNNWHTMSLLKLPREEVKLTPKSRDDPCKGPNTVVGSMILPTWRPLRAQWIGIEDLSISQNVR